MKMLEADYIKKFKCIGAECEDHCCKEWNIFIDKKSYKRYKKIKSNNSGLNFDKNIKRNKHSINDEDYGKILLKNSICGFFNKNKLCDIYCNLGEEFMCNTCTIYPRYYNLVDEHYENSLSISCPEAARVVLLNKQKMEFDLVELNKTILYPMRTINTKKNKLNSYFWEIRMLIIELLQNRDLNIEERLVILGLFINKLSDCIKFKRYEKIIDEIEFFKRNIKENMYLEFLKSIPSNIKIQLEILHEIIRSEVIETVRENYKMLIDKIYIALKLNESENNEIYRQAYNEYYQEVLENYGFVLENYLVNYCFKNLFPLGSGEDIFKEYVYMVIHFSLIKISIIGLCAYNKREINEEEIIMLIYNFSRAIEHNSAIDKIIYEWLQKNELNNLAIMTMMIKN